MDCKLNENKSENMLVLCWKTKPPYDNAEVCMYAQNWRQQIPQPVLTDQLAS